MVLYFSGTGNSRYVAQAISAIIQDEIISLNDYIKRECKDIIKSDAPLVFVAPTYAWRIPRVVEKFIRKVHFEGNNKAYFVLTCGDDTGNSVRYVKSLCREKNFEFMGFASVVMPENYVALFDVPGKTQADIIINSATAVIKNIANHINKNQHLLAEKVSFSGKVMSGIVNPIFYLVCVKSKKFYATNKCSRCKRCAELCPLNNISFTENKPHWGKTCTHCMACICGCHNAAIEYGQHTVNKMRYYNEVVPPIKYFPFYKNR